MEPNNENINEEKNTAPVKKKKKVRSYPILVLTGFYTLLFVAMLVYICNYSYKNKQVLFNNNYNTRQQILIAQNTRGNIVARGGEVLAYTEQDSEGKDKRVYPYGKEFSHVVGYASNGKSGLEALTNYYLINTSINLNEKLEYEMSGKKYPGDNVLTSLDVNLQEVAYNALSARRGAIIVSDPKTGQILAMVSKPDFDPNYIQEQWEILINDNSGDAMLVNRATQGLYPPGSTFKIVTALAYLRDHADEIGSYSYSCNGRFTKDGDSISCFHGESHGKVDFYSSFAKSCNSSFANMGLSVDESTFKKTLDDLMFNQDIPVSLSHSISSAEYKKDMSTAEVMQLSIGQGTTGVSPAHINLITSAIANDGMMMKPYFVTEIKAANGETVKSYSPESYKRIMTEEEAKTLREMMEQVVETGTATKLKGLSYTAAGKTGSAEFNTSTSDSHAWFTGFAPAEDPEICVTIIVENAGSGGSYAVPIAKRLFDAYFGVE
jgi:peptidoglycan glycosyltransferase